MSDPAPDRVVEFRFDLYSRAYDALVRSCGANELLRFHAQSLGCRRAAEGVELAEHHAEVGSAKVPETYFASFASRIGDCPDCAREACLAAEEIDRAARETSRGDSRRARRSGSSAA